MRVKYTGGAATNRDVGLETGEGDVLEPGGTYEVSAELGARLLRTAHWKKVAEPKAGADKSDKPAAPAERSEQ